MLVIFQTTKHHNLCESAWRTLSMRWRSKLVLVMLAKLGRRSIEMPKLGRSAESIFSFHLPFVFCCCDEFHRKNGPNELVRSLQFLLRLSSVCLL